MDKFKWKAMVLGLICAGSLTTAVIKLHGNDSVSADDVNQIAETIDETDFTNEAEVAELTATMNDWGEYVGGEFQSAHLERVIDGDTIVVDIEGEQYKVRLIGVNTPESVASAEYLEKSGKENTAEGKAASDYTKNALADYEFVYLQADVSDTDRYDRLLRYVWVEVPDDMYDAREIETKMLNAMLVADDMAAVEIYHPDDKYAETFYDIAKKHNNSLTDYER